MADETPKTLTDKGAQIVRRGGADGQSDDDILILEILDKMPGISANDCKSFFVALRLEFGEDARYALKNGHVSFEKRKPQ